ncbi:MAG: DUF2807 domain-containing protein [Bacteroidales bacterium]|nr:DUF2807 domain-containing protein [Bacteroidales bacterium]
MKTQVYTSIAIVLSLLLASCDNFWGGCIDGNGYRITETRDLDSFEQIQINGDFEVEIDTGSTPLVQVRADENLIDIIVTHVSGNRLIIESRNGTCLKPSWPIEIVVTIPYVTQVNLNGSGYVYCYGMDTEDLKVILTGSGQIDMLEVKATNMYVELEGSGTINTGIIVENIEAQIEGSGEIRLSGTAVNSDLKITGSGRLKTDDMITEVCFAYISGSGIIDTHVLNALNVTIIGSGIVYYEGNPEVESFVSGSGRVVKH